MQEKRVRIAKWDNLKFFLILCVVIGHFFMRYDDNSKVESLLFFVYTFHMPAFVFMSGLFSKKAINEKRYDKIFSFLIMYIVTRYALFFIRMFYSESYSFSYSDMNNVSWYAFAVFVFYLVTIFIKQFDKKYVLVFSFVVGCISGYATDIGTFLSIGRILSFYPIFLLGYYLKPEDVLNLTKKKTAKIIAMIILIMTAYVSYGWADELSWLMHIFRGKNSYEVLGQYANQGALIRLGWYVTSVLLTFSLIAITPSIHCIFTKWGGRTMQVYALHYVPMLAFFSLFHWNKWVEKIWPEHYLILILIIAFVTTCILSIRPIEIVMNAIIYPKKSKE